jgi:hypothetical protein
MQRLEVAKPMETSGLAASPPYGISPPASLSSSPPQDAPKPLESPPPGLKEQFQYRVIQPGSFEVGL